jgi:ATP-dependent Clp protease ATP-binding subunit ClpA
MASLLLGNKATSLMFDDKEIDNIDRAIDSLRNNQVYSPEDGAPIFDALLDKKNKEAEAAREKAKQDEFNEKSYIYLASIMYSTPQDWVVWINDKKITSETNKKNKELYLKSVQKDQVSILWSVSASKLQVLLGKKADDLKLKLNENNQIEVRFVLQPNQTYILGSNSVVEGKAVVSMIKRKEPEAAHSKVPAH